MDKYEGNDNYGKPKSVYLEKLSKMTDDELQKETEHKIWLSAWAANNRRSDYHWHCDACYDACKQRGKPEIYNSAYKEVEKEIKGETKCTNVEFFF
jgi:hypothetical protein